MKELILGGVKSGKSDFALRDLEPQVRKIFLATAEALDEEMLIRITRHKEDRCPSFETIEEPVEIAGKITNIQKEIPAPLIVLDCLTLWVSNLLFRYENRVEREKKIDELVRVITNYSGTIRIISNEVGFGIIPDSKLAREYGDQLGMLNQRIAKIVDRVIVMFAGLPVTIKG